MRRLAISMGMDKKKKNRNPNPLTGVVAPPQEQLGVAQATPDSQQGWLRPSTIFFFNLSFYFFKKHNVEFF